MRQKQRALRPTRASHPSILSRGVVVKERCTLLACSLPTRVSTSLKEVR